ncbi:hypothetical protein CASFOL_041339 [Castilleja foliolosa]|uniref:Membrane-associated kinase regulator 6 n=1 Tax=Castilleja foliolosa TaxID=1961234 RepID=A0ABD3BEP1_9LAMI
MEKQNIKPLATDSFSYSWFTDQPNFVENSDNEQQCFDFDVPAMYSSSIYNLVHADELFSDGQIKPVYVQKSRPEPFITSNSISTPPISIFSPTSPSVSNHMKNDQFYLLGNWRKSSKKILRKCFGFVKPLCKTLGSSRKSNRVDDLERKVFEIRSLSTSCEASPRPSSACSVFEWADVEKIAKKSDFFHGFEKKRNSTHASPNISPARSSNVWCDAENSIQEAILYCKRSIEK